MSYEYLLDINENTYYQQNEDSGDYQFVTLENIINQFIIAYVGQDKIIPKARRADVAFHAQRAIQELSYDTFKSITSQELIVPSNLSLMLPQDYVNYTNISWVDGAGIQHTVYPTNKVSNTQYRGNLVTNSHLHTNTDDWTLGTGWTWDNKSKEAGAILGTSVALEQEASIPVRVVQGRNYTLRYYISHPIPAISGQTQTLTDGKLKISLYGDEGYVNAFESHSGVGLKQVNLHLNATHPLFVETTDTKTHTLVFEPVDGTFTGLIDRVSLVEVTSTGPDKEILSTSWSNYKSNTPNDNVDKYDDGTYDLMQGERYGLHPQHAQVNGSFFIEPTTGKLHFSSNLSGKTVILKYISDGLARTRSDDNIAIVHKFAEEAVYKWIAHAILATRINIPEYVVNRFKKERFAAVRQAKLRLSNIKIEELTQILRGKSKWIKH